MKIHYTQLSDAQITVVVGRLAGQSNARIQNSKAWVGRAYDLMEAGRDHQEQVEKCFALATDCRLKDGRAIFVSNRDERTADASPCRSRTLGAMFKAFPSGIIDVDDDIARPLA